MLEAVYSVVDTGLMIERIAVISDIHGVLPALEAVLEEEDVKTADLIVVTGDHAAGPQPAAVLNRLLGLGEQVRLVRGNADRDLVTIANHGTPPEGTPEVDIWAAQQLEPHHLDLLANLPHPVTIPLAGTGDVLFCHGSPRDDNEVMLVDTRLSQWTRILDDVSETVRIVCGGHTHMPFVRLVDRRWVVNSGSIGMPYGSGFASWALLDSRSVQLRHTPVDAQVVADTILADSDYPDARQWVEDYILGPPSDTDALQAFGPRDGRSPAWNDIDQS